LLEFIGEPRADDRFVVLLSGGASALCALPAQGVTLEQKRRETLAVMASGASIAEINRVRQRLSAIKGGRLAARLAPAQFATLAISDVPGDDPLVIGSAPTWSEDLAHGDGRYAVIATLDDALEAAATAARAEGFEVVPLGRCLYGSVEDETTRVLQQILKRGPDDHRHPNGGPVVLIAGGEPLVVVRGAGRGGRAQELALRLGLALGSQGDALDTEISGLVAGTDGSDGPTSAAGAFFDGQTMARVHRANVDAAGVLDASDSGSALAAIDDLFVTGPTGTNVADILMVAILGR
jgi:hydroxypyruvate reductase